MNNLETINYTIILNETLNMSEHMKVTMKKARSRVNLFRRIQPLIDVDTASLIFKVMILTIFTHCPYSTFGNIPNYVENKVQNIENRAQRIISKHYLIVSRTFKNDVLQHVFTNV